MTLRYKVYLFILFVLSLDQASKIWVKTHMTLGQEHVVLGDWFYLLFTENPGMAFGVTLGNGTLGKLILIAFRLVVSVAMAWLIHKLLQRKVATGLLIGISSVFAGAVGNVIDSTFYGLLFSDSLGQVAQLLPPDGGYGGFFHGRVVDMLYFPIIDTHYPSWIPVLGGNELMLFGPIFNIADAAISIGFFYIFLFQRKSLNRLVYSYTVCA